MSGANAGVTPQIEFATCWKLFFWPLAAHTAGLLHPTRQRNHPATLANESLASSSVLSEHWFLRDYAVGGR
ncbi:MAG: hypothetical protein DMF03_13685 [Verrucomicrobia bacterium]|nr:MAG: hypothetical protein DMF03_13685 [Verrucomicrobiota bacterium]